MTAGSKLPLGREADPLLELLRQRLQTADTPVLRRFVAHLRRAHGSDVAAILFYGSCLFSETRTRTSFHDFYLLADGLGRYHRSLWHTALNLVLPPNVYYAAFSSLRVMDGVSSGDRDLRCKYCVMSLRQFCRETSPAAHDIHHLGRFSKRFALIYSRDSEITQRVIEGALRSMLALVPHSLALLPRAFTLDQFIIQQLSLSYLGERRVAEPDKVFKLFQSSEAFYREIYEQLLETYGHCWGIQAREGLYTQAEPRTKQRASTEGFLRRSRKRGVLRWPKYILTVDNWLQYILDKLERHHGVELQLTRCERRFPLIFGWPKYFALRRRGIVG